MPYVTPEDSVKVNLKSDPKYWVEIVSDLSWKQMKGVQGISQNAADGVKVDAMLLASIKSWNLDDDNGILPITTENIDQLKYEDIEVILTALGAELKEDKEIKKNS